MDLGGRSTELILGDAGSGMVESATSLPMGCLSLSRVLPAGPAATPAEAVDAAVSHAADVIQADDSAAASLAAAGEFIGVGGTITTAAGMVAGLSEYDSARVDNSTVSADQLLRLAERAATSEGRERCAVLVALV